MELMHQVFNEFRHYMKSHHRGRLPSDLGGYSAPNYWKKTLLSRYRGRLPSDSWGLFCSTSPRYTLTTSTTKSLSHGGGLRVWVECLWGASWLRSAGTTASASSEVADSSPIPSCISVGWLSPGSAAGGRGGRYINSSLCWDHRSR